MSSRRREVVPSSAPAPFGTRSAIDARATTPMTVIAQKVERQPSCWPSRVPKGTPRTFAAVRPVNITAIAPA